MLRYEVINTVIDTYGYDKYLEIGAAFNATFDTIPCSHKVSVDIYGEPTYKMSSDEFFAQNTEKFDIIFVDGDHSTEQAKRDIYNALDVLTDDGTLVIHDTYPTAEYMQLDDGDRSRYWMGGVWKTVAELRTRSDLSVRTVFTDCGVTIVRKGKQRRMTIPEELDYAFFEKNHKRLLNLISVEDFVAAP